LTFIDLIVVAIFLKDWSCDFTGNESHRPQLSRCPAWQRRV